jgi:hypothetical protein
VRECTIDCQSPKARDATRPIATDNVADSIQTFCSGGVNWGAIQDVADKKMTNAAVAATCHEPVPVGKFSVHGHAVLSTKPTKANIRMTALMGQSACIKLTITFPCAFKQSYLRQ